MNRYRLVTQQRGAPEHVSSVILSHAEALEALQVERDMHQAAGWLTKRLSGHLRCQRGDTERWIWIRESDPMEDTL